MPDSQKINMLKSVVVVAVVVTYNRKELLKKCLFSIKNQSRIPEAIVIVDNGSTDGTVDWLREYILTDLPIARLIALSQNIGGAGGFNVGIKEAYHAGADWIWIMDDDCVPELNCLENLVITQDKLHENNTQKVGFLASRVIWKDGSPCLMNIPVPHALWIEPYGEDLKISRISSSSFVSMLLSREAVYQYGLPVKEFFIWFDDVEYSKRISAYMQCYLVHNSVAVHMTAENIGALDFYHLDEKSLWKFKYGIRNESSFRFHNNGFLDGLIFLGKMIVRMNRARCKWKIRAQIIKACLDGYFFNYKKMYEYI